MKFKILKTTIFPPKILFEFLKSGHFHRQWWKMRLEQVDAFRLASSFSLFSKNSPRIFSFANYSEKEKTNSFEAEGKFAAVKYSFQPESILKLFSDWTWTSSRCFHDATKWHCLFDAELVRATFSSFCRSLDKCALLVFAGKFTSCLFSAPCSQNFYENMPQELVSKECKATFPVLLLKLRKNKQSRRQASKFWG